MTFDFKFVETLQHPGIITSVRNEDDVSLVLISSQAQSNFDTSISNSDSEEINNTYYRTDEEAPIFQFPQTKQEFVAANIVSSISVQSHGWLSKFMKKLFAKI